MRMIKELSRRNPLVLFYLLAFAISWLGRVPLALSSHGLLALENPLLTTVLFLLGGVAPTLAAIIAAAALKGKTGPDMLLAQFQRAGVGAFWYLAALLAPFLFMLLGFSADRLLYGSPAPAWSDFRWLGLPFMFLSVFFSYVWEEIGWRGFALPRLEGRYSALVASVIIALLGSLWHLPLMLNKGLASYQIPLLPQLAFSLASAILFTWLYNNSGGSLLVVSFFHTSLNVTAGLSMSLVGERGFVRQYTPVAYLWLALAVIIVVVYGARRLSRGDTSEIVSTWET